jgi:hypothetical protein
MNRALSLAALAAALVGCADVGTEASIEPRSLEEMLELGANQYLIDKYEEAGRETNGLLRMLEVIGRDGPGLHPEFTAELAARGFAFDEGTARASRGWQVERRSM